MKRNIFILCVLYFLAAIPFQAFALENGIEGKIGTSYANDPEKFGLNLDFFYFMVPDPYLALGIESGFTWLEWERKVGTEEISPGVSGAVEAETNVFVVPVMFNAQIRLADLKDKFFVEPYITIGVGYSFMILDYSQPSYEEAGTGEQIESDDKTQFYDGFTWQILTGVAVKPGQRSNIHMVAEFGYRNMKLERDNVEIDMSGFVLNIGARIPFTIL